MMHLVLCFVSMFLVARQVEWTKTWSTWDNQIVVKWTMLIYLLLIRNQYINKFSAKMTTCMQVYQSTWNNIIIVSEYTKL